MKLYDKHGILLDKGEWREVISNEDIVEVGDSVYNKTTNELTIREAVRPDLVGMTYAQAIDKMTKEGFGESEHGIDLSDYNFYIKC